MESGATRDVRETQSLTAEETILGTPQYMAPEQVEGKEVDARADVFAFGAVVYEMATGRRAFTGGSHASLIAAILTTDPPPMATLEPLTPPALERIVKKCLAKDREARWQTARDLLDELKWVGESGAQSGMPASVAAAPGSPLGATQVEPFDAAQGKRATTAEAAHRAHLAIAAASLMLGAGLAAAGMWTLIDRRPHRSSPFGSPLRRRGI